MKKIRSKSGIEIPVFGLGTWRMGEDPTQRKEEIATIQRALDLGISLIDTAEMYGSGECEELVGKALEGRRKEAFLVSKVLPQNASRQAARLACERSLQRLKTEHIDLYLLHWSGAVPVSETMEAFMDLLQEGKIRSYGVSNLDLSEMQQLWNVPGGNAIATNQLLYNLTRRGIEWDLLPWLRERGVPVMAYSPLEQARLANNRALQDFARRHGLTAAQVALSWLLAKDDLIVIPKTSNCARLKENLEALDHRLSSTQLAELDTIFPPPAAPSPLEML